MSASVAVSTSPSQCVSVAVRIRPLLHRELANGDKEELASDASGKRVLMHGELRDYLYDCVFSATASTEQVYASAVQPIVAAAIDGYNGTVFAYGQTSSGKSHTILGTESQPGISRLAVADIFERIELRETTHVYQVTVSIIELYNEVITDLLSGRTGLQLRQCGDVVKVADVSEEVVDAHEHVDALFNRALADRRTSGTVHNEQSSRSHVVLRLTISGRHIDSTQHNAMCVAELNLVDLAGSEQYDTAATGERCKETKSINSSLSALTTVIKRLTEPKTGPVPYRDSKLTRLLQNSLGGNAQTSIICNCAPIVSQQTKSTLDFAKRAKCVKNNPVKNEKDCADANAIAQREVMELKGRLEELTSERAVDKAALQQENETLRDEIDSLRRKMTSLGQQITFYSGALLYAQGDRGPSAKSSRRRTIHCTAGGALCSTPSRRAPSLFSGVTVAQSPGAVAVPRKRPMLGATAHSGTVASGTQAAIRESTETETSDSGDTRLSLAEAQPVCGSPVSIVHIEQLRGELESVRSDNATLGGENAELAAQLAQLQSAKSELDALRLAHCALESEHVDVAHANYKLAQQLHKADDDYERLQSELASVSAAQRSAIDQLHSAKCELVAERDSMQRHLIAVGHESAVPVHCGKRPVADPNLEQTAADLTALTLDGSSATVRSGAVSPASDIGAESTATSDRTIVCHSPSTRRAVPLYCADGNLEQSAAVPASPSPDDTATGTVLAGDQSPLARTRTPPSVTVATPPPQTQTQEHSEHLATIAQLQAENGALERRLCSAESLVTEQVRSEIERVMADNQMLNAELALQRDRLALIQAEIEARDCDNGDTGAAAASAPVAVSAVAVAQCDAAVNTTHSQCIAQRDNEQQTTDTTHSGDGDNGDLRGDYEEVVQLSEKLYEEKVQLEEKVESVCNERDAHRSRIDQLQSRLEQFNEYIDNKETSMAATASFLVHETQFTAEANHEQMQSELAAAQEQLTELKQQLDVEQKSSSAAKQSVADYEWMLQAERKQSQCKVAQLQTALTDANEQIAAMQLADERHHTAVQCSEDEMSTVKESLRDAQANCDRLQSELSALQQQLCTVQSAGSLNRSQLDDDVQQLKLQLDRLQTQLDVEQKSSSAAKQSVADYEWMLQGERKQSQGKVAQLQTALDDAEEQLRTAQLATEQHQRCSEDEMSTVTESLRVAQADCDRQQSELSALQSALDDAEEQLRTAQLAAQQHSDASHRSEHSEGATVLKESLRVAEAELHRLNGTLAAQTQQLADNAALVQSAQASLCDSEHCAKSLVSQRDQLQCALDGERGERAALAENHAQALRDADGRRLADIDSAVSQCRSEFESQLATAAAGITSLRHELQLATDKCAGHEEELVSLRRCSSELCDLRQLLSDRGVELASARSELDAARRTWQCDMDELQRQLHAAKEMHALWEQEKLAELQSLNESVQRAELNATDASAKAERAVAEQQQCEQRLSRRERQLAVMRRACAEYEQTCGQMDDMEAQFKHKQQQLQEEIDRLNQLLAAKQDGVNGDNAPCAANEVQRLQTELEDAQRKSGLQVADYDNRLATERSRYKDMERRLTEELRMKEMRVRSLKDEVRKLHTDEPTISLPPPSAAGANVNRNVPQPQQCTKALSRFETTMANKPRGTTDIYMMEVKHEQECERWRVERDSLQQRIAALQSELVHWQNRSLHSANDNTASGNGTRASTSTVLREHNANAQAQSQSHQTQPMGTQHSGANNDNGHGGDAAGTPHRKKRFHMFGSARKEHIASGTKAVGKVPQSRDEPVNKADEPTCKQQ